MRVCVCVYIYIYIYIYECECIYMYKCVCVHIHVCICIYVCACIYICVCVCIYVCVCICVYTCLYIYIYIHIYIHSIDLHFSYSVWMKLHEVRARARTHTPVFLSFSSSFHLPFFCFAFSLSPYRLHLSHFFNGVTGSAYRSTITSFLGGCVVLILRISDVALCVNIEQNDNIWTPSPKETYKEVNKRRLL